MPNATIRIEQLVIPTYPEPGKEEMPLFAEHRVHQRSTGRPYPNKAVLEVMDVHEAHFGIRYCDAILNSNDVVPHYLQLARQLKEPTTTYYDYRKQVLRTIKQLLKTQSTTDI